MNAMCGALVALAGLLAGNVQAANWVKIVGEKDGIEIAIDAKSIRTTDGVVQAWELFNFDTPDQFQGKSASSVKYLYNHKCAERTVALARGIFYEGRDGEGDELSDNASSEIVYLEPIPGTVGEKGLNFVCSYARKHKK